MAPVVTIGGRKIFVVPEGPTLKLHEPIHIDKNPEFVPKKGVVSGSGTINDPYIIEGWDIDIAGDGPGIRIRDTTDHFVIRNCKIRNGSAKIGDMWYGIYFKPAQNGKIDNCAVYRNYYGIVLASSSNRNIITNCTVYDNFDYGIYLEDSSNNLVVNSTIYNNSYGVRVRKSESCQIHYCNIYGNTRYGVVNLDTHLSIAEINATDNWWGDESGPRHITTNPNGKGDNVSDNVPYTPFLRKKLIAGCTKI